MKNPFLRSILREGEPASPGGGDPTPAPSTILGDPSATPDPTPAPADPAPASPTPSEPSPFALNIYDDAGNLTEEFKASVPEDQQGLLKHFGKYKTTADALKGTHSLMTMAKRGEVGPLADDAPDHVKAEHAAMIRKANGAPEIAGDYVYPVPEGMEASDLDQDAVKAAQEIAHKGNVPQETFKEFADLQQSREQAIHASYAAREQQLVQDGIATLTKEFGSEAGAKFQAASRAVGEQFPDVNVATDPAFQHPTSIKMALKIAELTAPDGGLKGGSLGGAADGGNYREQSKAIAQDPNNTLYAAYHDQNHPNHQHAKAEKTRLSKLAAKAGQH